MTTRDEFHWMTTASGTRFHLMKPSEWDVRFTDIAHALSNLCRFTGHTSTFYSVAQHSVLVAEHVPYRIRPLALLHDAHEAYLGDISRPVVNCLEHGKAEILIMKARIDRAIYDAFELTPTADDLMIVKRADDRALATEARDLVCKDPDPWWRQDVAFPERIEPVRPAEAYEMFATYADEIGLRERGALK